MRRALACLPLALLFIANVVPTKAQTEAASTPAPATTTPKPIKDRVDLIGGDASAPGAVQYYDIPRNVSFTCNIPYSGSGSYAWEKNGTDISKVPELKDRYKLGNNNAWLNIVKTSDEDAGSYACKLGDTYLYWQLQARPYTKFQSGDSSVVEGQKLKLVCKLIGRPLVPVKWYYKAGVLWVEEKPEKKTPPEGDLVVANDRIKLEKNDAGVENGQLVIDAAATSDAGAYTCVADAPADAESPHPHGVTVLRVKDMYAALWPFLGICAEVLVLCAIILVYEKRRTKPELDDSDTDNHDQKKS